MSVTQALESRELVITRWLSAPRELVFDAWTQPEHIAHWWGPKDFTVPFCQVDARKEGRYRACIRSPEGADYWVRGEFHEVDPPARLVFTWAWEDDDAKPGHETRVTLVFESVSDGTLMTFRQGVFESVDDRDAHEGGWSECFDRLQSWLQHGEHVKELAR